MPDKLFEGIANFPANIFWQGQREAAIEIAKLIEEKAGTNTKQLIGLAAFYIGIEYAGRGKAVGGKDDPARPEHAGCLPNTGPGIPDELPARGIGTGLSEGPGDEGRFGDFEAKPGRDEARAGQIGRGRPRFIAKYWRSNPDDSGRGTGLILCLFDAGKKAEAESEMAKSLEKDAE